MTAFPYVYKLTHKDTGEFYIGVRWANIYPANLDIGKRYWTSSRHVKPIFHEFDIEIVAEFPTKDDAISFEQKMIADNWNDPLILNKVINITSTFRCEGHTEETKLKMSNSKKGKSPNNKGKKLSVETREKIRENSLRFRHTEESIAKIRAKAIGNKRGIGNKSRIGQKQSQEERDKKSQTLKANPSFLGKHHTEEAKTKLRLAMLNQPKSTCPYCLREFGPANFARLHGEKCKLRIQN